ncbi:MAG TPA: hypothetical protein PK564_02070 [bacterium]|jgi:hypothetical protein|nr:hypothetical protein [bacterium]
MKEIIIAILDIENKRPKKINNDAITDKIFFLSRAKYRAMGKSVTKNPPSGDSFINEENGTTLSLKAMASLPVSEDLNKFGNNKYVCAIMQNTDNTAPAKSALSNVSLFSEIEKRKTTPTTQDRTFKLFMV